MRVAVIGSGIAGNAAAWALATGSRHEVIVYEREARLGGHALTVDVALGSAAIPVDAGFIVYNEDTYPDFTRLLAHLGVATKRADMSFCLARADGGVVWTSRGRLPLPGGGAAQLLRLVGDWLRFNHAAGRDLGSGRLGRMTLGDYAAALGLSARFRDDYLVALASAIWSMPGGTVLGIPARTFVAFFDNHRLLRLRRPAWRTITGGSRAYVERLAAPWRHAVRPGAARIERHDLCVTVTDASGAADRFDALVLACHPDEALALLADADEAERAVLGAIRFRPADVILHRDESLMPNRRDAWAAWTILDRPGPDGGPAVTYWMNALQGIDPATPLFVSLDPPRLPAEARTLARFRLSHPQLDAGAVAAQARLGSIQARRRTWFCGAWTGYGFHEDGVRSGLDAAEALGARVPWRASPRSEAAE
ncbi:NAD(P)/FAD-dependent oxidoreductase [Salinarimonas soli]|uniref:NAD(P)-binding protein n=1 Tax=Salinarimonas soli TaxID=1638099 RepID=A0A5B2V7C1_9HYPH|nr:FAD-dependent oxidoreductase [Salinarimonas soli]KAA2235393.1 NAD(P)-binding protein [Salinarimonas soli]